MNAPDATNGVGRSDVLAAAVALRWCRPDLTRALAEHLAEEADAQADRDAWLVAAGWRLQAVHSVGDGRDVAADLLEEIRRWDDGALGTEAAARLRVELAVVAHDAGETAAAAALLAHPTAEHDAELAADRTVAAARCVGAGTGEELTDLETVWDRVGEPRAGVGSAAVRLVAAVTERRAGRSEQAAAHAVTGLTRLDRTRGAAAGPSPSGHLAAALAAEWIAALVDADRWAQAREVIAGLAARLGERTRPTRQLAYLRSTIARVLAADPTADAGEELERAARDAAAADVPDLEHVCRVALGELHETHGRLEAALESIRLAVLAERRHRARAARFRAVLADLEGLLPLRGAPGPAVPDPAADRTTTVDRPGTEPGAAAADLPPAAPIPVAAPAVPERRGRVTGSDPWTTGSWIPTGDPRGPAAVRSRHRRAEPVAATGADGPAGADPPGGVPSVPEHAARREDPDRVAADPDRAPGERTAPVPDQPVGAAPDQTDRDRIDGGLTGDDRTEGDRAGGDRADEDRADEDRADEDRADGHGAPGHHRTPAPRHSGVGSAGPDADRDPLRAAGEAVDDDRAAADAPDRSGPGRSGGEPDTADPDPTRTPGPLVGPAASADADPELPGPAGARPGPDPAPADRDTTPAVDLDRPAAPRAVTGPADDDLPATDGPGGEGVGPARSDPRPDGGRDPQDGDGSPPRADERPEVTDPWLAAALAELDRIRDGGRPAPEVEGCTVVLDLTRGADRLPDGEAAAAMQQVAARLSGRLPDGARMRTDSPGALAVVMPGRDRAAASEWMRTAVPDLAEGLAAGAAAGGTLLRASVHGIDGVVGAQVLQRVGASAPPSGSGRRTDRFLRPAEAGDRSRSSARSGAATGSTRVGAVPARAAAPDAPEPGPAGTGATPPVPAGVAASPRAPSTSASAPSASDPAGTGPGAGRPAGPGTSAPAPGTPAPSVAGPPVQAPAAPAPTGTRTAAADADSREDTAPRRPYLPDGVVVRPGSGGRRYRPSGNGTATATATATPATRAAGAPVRSVAPAAPGGAPPRRGGPTGRGGAVAGEPGTPGAAGPGGGPHDARAADPVPDPLGAGPAPHVSAPDVSAPDATALNATALNATALNATALNATALNATDLNATDLNATDPNATDPNATDPNATDPNATDPLSGRVPPVLPDRSPRPDPAEPVDPTTPSSGADRDQPAPDGLGLADLLAGALAAYRRI